MTPFVHLLLLGPALLLAVGCEEQPREDGAGGDGARTAQHTEPVHAGADTGAAPEALPLRPIMQRLASDMAGFSHALWLEDHAEMTARAAAMADHPHISTEEIRRIEAALGPDMPAFEEADEVVHIAAIRMQEAAAARRQDEVVTRLGEVQRGCVSCHSRFRDRLRTDRS